MVPMVRSCGFIGKTALCTGEKILYGISILSEATLNTPEGYFVEVTVRKPTNPSSKASPREIRLVYSLYCACGFSWRRCNLRVFMGFVGLAGHTGNLADQRKMEGDLRGRVYCGSIVL